jgi:hypothetical protein
MQSFIILSQIADINECDSRPCDTSAKCIDTDGSFICICDEGLSKNGNKCEGNVIAEGGG